MAEPISSIEAARIARDYFAGIGGGSSATPITSLVGGLEALCDAGEHGLVLLVVAVARLRGHRRKPARAFERFSRIGRDDVPAELSVAIERIVALARD